MNNFGVTVLLASVPAAFVAGTDVKVEYNFFFSNAFGRLEEDYKVFVHFIDSTARIRFQDDHYPPTPTSQWYEGDHIAYTRTVRVPLLKPNGRYKMLIGLSKPGVGRLGLSEGSGVTHEGSYRYKVADFVLSGQAEGDVLPVVFVGPGQSIQEGLNAVVGGGTLVLKPGVHSYSDVLLLEGANSATIRGWGATLNALEPKKQALHIKNCELTTVEGLTYHSTPPKREQNDTSCAILVQGGQDIFVQDNRILDSACGAIHVRETKGFYIRDNVVERSRADGIHCTNKASDGWVYDNTTRNTGDDGIALVGYVKDGGWIKDVEICDNTIENNLHGRGITMEGTENVGVFDNKVSNTSSAGIIVMSNSKYNTYGNKNVQIKFNTLVNCNYDPDTVHGGILISGRADYYNEAVFVENNTVAETVHTTHIRVLDFNKDVHIVENDIQDVDSSEKAIAVSKNMPAEEIEIVGNTYNGELIP